MADELEALQAKLAARQNVPGFKENCAHIEQRIAEIQKERGETEEGN